MGLKVAINGFGRIGRLILRAAAEQRVLGREIEVVAVADVSTDAEYFAYLLKHDSVHGKFPCEVAAISADTLVVDGQKIRCIPAANDPSGLPWRELGVEVVLEASGLFTNGDMAAGHLKAGARKVIITAPAQGEVKTIIVGVNEHEYDEEIHHVISAASCTANCLAIPLKVLIDEGVGIESGIITALNSYTASQKITDGFSKRDWRSGRAAAANIIPSQTSASKIALDVFPGLRGRVSGLSFRIPTLDVSVVDLTFRSVRNSSVIEIDNLMRRASETYLKGYLGYTREELVSTDFVHDSHSSIFDSSATLQSNVEGEKQLFRLVFWYDNEWGYSNRIVDLIKIVLRAHPISRFDWAAFEALA
ncbi:MAG: type I glyceraldehyde-3-phosphate dehydrogenase [Candidatus Omnitrophica bacterium]|nr:type I glyceraldehyde-3-phosphate dehydrogenase [Candidatus Omnitrophota bacterium]